MGWEWCHPLYGAVVSAVLAALAIGLVSLYAHQREDTVIGALWSIGMAVGLIFLARTPGYVDAMSYLFGNILMTSSRDVWLVAGLDALVVCLAVVFYHQFLAVCMDQQFAELQGVPVKIFYLLLLGLTALTIVLLVTVVGIVLVIALLTLPAAIAGHFTRRLWSMMIVAVVLSVCFTAAGLAVSYVKDLPSGPTIVLLAGCGYLVVVAGHRVLRRLPRHRTR